MKLIISLVSLFSLLTFGFASGPWCLPQAPGNCYLGWEAFSDLTNTGTIYDHACNPICNEFQQIPGYKLAYDDHEYPPSPLYNFNTMENGHLSDDVFIQYYDYSGSGGKNPDRAPVFWFGDNDHGGLSGCTCFSGNLDHKGTWGCRCPFACQTFA